MKHSENKMRYMFLFNEKKTKKRSKEAKKTNAPIRMERGE